MMQQSTFPTVVFLSKNPSQTFKFTHYGTGMLRIDQVTIGCIELIKDLNTLGLRLYSLGTREYVQIVVRNIKGQIITNDSDFYQLSLQSVVEIKAELRGVTYLIEITIK